MFISKARLLTLALSAVFALYIIFSFVVADKSSNTMSTFSQDFLPDPVFKGRILVTIIERYAGPERTLNYLIDLVKGTISVSPQGQLPKGVRSLGGRIDECRLGDHAPITAPNGELAADCAAEGSDGKNVGPLVIIHKKTGEQIKQWTEGKEWKIHGIVWSMDSQSVVVLSAKERTDFRLGGVIAMASGHPIPLVTFKVTLLSIQTNHELNLPEIRKDSPSGWARLDWIP